MNTLNNEKCIEVFNSLLRGELSAIETYNQALEKFKAEAESAKLESIKADHVRAVDKLRANVVKMGGEPSSDSGAWGTFATSVEGAAKLFGENSAVWALQQGEQHGRNDYQDALDNEDVEANCKELIRTELLPLTEQHITTLEAIQN